MDIFLFTAVWHDSAENHQQLIFFDLSRLLRCGGWDNRVMRVVERGLPVRNKVVFLHVCGQSKFRTNVLKYCKNPKPMYL